MDINKTYIKMCMKTEELQQGHRFIYGDLWSDDGEEALLVMPSHFPVANCVWLPHQDQLQEMIADEWDEELIISDLFRRTYIGSDNEGNLIPNDSGINWDDIDSHEKMWLAFVMKQLYEKIWNGEDWE